MSRAVALMAFLAPFPALAATYYVAPTGSDGAAGTQAAPWASMAKAVSTAVAGDTVYFRGGTYAYTAAQSACSSSTATVNGVLLNKSGTSGNPINYWAYTGETPVFDFSGIKDQCRITGFQVTGSWLYLKGLAVTGVPQNINTNHESWGIYVNGGSNNIFEQLDLYKNMGPGLFIIRGGNNHVINCDSHENYDPNSGSASAPGGDAGGNADGFGFHSTSTADSGTLFSGCRAWLNSDDGWDFIEAVTPVTLENSWSFHNGYYDAALDTTSQGNGNGFKCGGYDLVAANVPAVVPQHTIHHCLAVSNKANGFYENHHAAADYFYNNTSYGNNSDFNLLGVASDGTTSMDLGILRNNIAYTGSLLSNNTGSGVDESYNSWDAALGVTVSAADFQSVSVTGLDSPRQADGSLPVLTNFHLAAGSALIDKGTNVGLPYNGAAPDLGCFETGGSTGGAPSTGGSKSTGGMTSSTGGSKTATGGTASSAGGATAPTGGTKAAVGGAIGTGGAVTVATGGVTGSGGTKAIGGTTSAAGSPGTGGVSATGGVNGGTATVGGGLSTGGFASVGGSGAATGGAAAVGGNASVGGTDTSNTSTGTGTAGSPSSDNTGSCSCRIPSGQGSPLGNSSRVALVGLACVAMLRRRSKK